MKLTLVFLIAALHVAAFQNGCQNRLNTSNAPGSQGNSMDQAALDRELLTNVEKFANDDYGSSAAWQNLMSHDRQKLINDLNRISYSLPPDDRNRVFIAYTFCKMRHDYERNRKVILSALSKNPQYKNLFGDWVVTLMGNLVVEGDKDLLVPLFQASEWADGAMGTDLAHVYSEALVMDAESFLVSLSSQSQNTRKGVIILLSNNSLTPEQNRSIKEYLRTVAPPSKLAPVAAQTLKALSK